MSKTVFILGAGASKQAGVPLMGEFLDVADSIWKEGKITEEDKEHFERVFRAIGKLQMLHSKSQLDLVNLEAVFSTFEMANLLKKLPGFEPDQLPDLLTSMKRLIVVTIEKTLKYPFSSGHAKEAEPYREFCKLLKDLKDTRNKAPDVSIITFNYDIAIDHALHYHNLGPDYQLQAHAGSENAVNLLKLHGSLNWGISLEHDQIFPFDLKDYFKKYSFRHIISDTNEVTINVSSHLYDQREDLKITGEPVIVPPTWNKSQYHSELTDVWSQAAKELEEAENIFVVGFSLPETDIFFKHLYALGTVGETPLKRFWVFDPDESGEVENRYRILLGPGALARFDYQSLTFEDAIQYIQNKMTGRSGKKARVF